MAHSSLQNENVKSTPSYRRKTIAIANTPPMVNASRALIDDDPEVVDLLLPADVVLEPDELPELPPEEVPEVPLVEPLTDVASPGRLIGATFARAWKAARVLFVAAFSLMTMVIPFWQCLAWEQ